MHVVIAGALPHSLINFHGDLIRSIIAAGHRVTALSAPASADEIAQLLAMGATHHGFDIDRTGLDPRVDIRCLRSLRKTFERLEPDVVLAFAIRPVIWSGIALQTMGSRTRFFGLILGLGYAFGGRGVLRRSLSSIASLLYRLSLRRADRVIFLNPQNRDLFLDRRIVERDKCLLVPGSGVETTRFAMEPLPDGEPVHFLMIARLLRSKGIREYAEAAAIVKARYPTAHFELVGPPDTSPDAMPLAEVEAFNHSGVIRWGGAMADVRPALAKCHVYVLPSYYPEGLPQSIVEAMSTGRPILTTDMPGCRETVVPGQNGWLVPALDVQALAARMIWCIENRSELGRMGQASRAMAIERFDVHAINRQMLAIMGLNKNEIASANVTRDTITPSHLPVSARHVQTVPTAAHLKLPDGHADS